MMTTRAERLTRIALFALVGLVVVLAQSVPISEILVRGTSPALLFERADLAGVALLASLGEPIDWSHPLAIYRLGYPGTSLLIADGLPLISLPLRILAEAGIRLDPLVVVGLVVRAFVALSPLTVYLLARSLGASRPAAAVSSALGIFTPALMFWNSTLTLGLTAWPLLALLLRELVLLDRRERRSWLPAAFLGGALWWCYPYLGAIGFALLAVWSLRVVGSRDLRSLLPVVGSSIALALLIAFDLPLPDRISISPAPQVLSALPSLLSVAPVSPLNSGISGPEAQWGLFVLLLVVGAFAAFAQQHRLLAVAIGSLALVSLGSIDEGGLLPTGLFELPLIALLDDVDRLFAPAALVGIALTPSLVERHIRRLISPLIAGVRIMLVIIAFVCSYGYIATPADPLSSLEMGWLSIPDRSVDDRAIGPLRELIRAHDSLIFLPMPFCGQSELQSDLIASLSLRRTTTGFAGLAAIEGVAATSFQTGRGLTHSLAGRDIRRSPLCRPEYSPAPERSLVVLSMLVDDEMTSNRWRLVGERLARCSRVVDIGVIESVVLCSDQDAAIERLEAQLARLEER